MWLLPSYNRPEKLARCLTSAAATKTTTPGLILIDEQDESRFSVPYGLPEGWVVRVTKARAMADKVREVIDTLDSTWVGLLNDDFNFVTDHWDQKLISKLDGKNFVSPNDRQPDRRAFMLPVTATAWSMDLIKTVGFPIYPDGMKHLFIDNLWRDLGLATGCWRLCANVIVEHHHVLWGKAQMDQTHEAVYNKKAWDYDEAIYKHFMEHSFKETVEKIQKLQGNLPSQRYNASPSRNPIAKPVEAQ